MKTRWTDGWWHGWVEEEETKKNREKEAKSMVHSVRLQGDPLGQ